MGADADETTVTATNPAEPGELTAKQRRQQEKERARKARADEKARKRRERRARRTKEPEEKPPAEAFWYAEGSTAAVVPFERLYEDGIMRLSDGKWSLSVSYEDTNYTLAREEDQDAMRAAWGHYLNGCSEDVALQMTLVSRRVDRAMFLRDYAYQRTGDERLDPYVDEFNGYIQSKLTASAASIRHERVMTFTTKADDHDKAARALAVQLKRFTRFVRSQGCACRVLSGQGRVDLLNSITRPDDEPGKYRFRTLEDVPGLRARDLVAPRRVWRARDDRDDSRLVIGGRWCKSYTILAEGWGPTLGDTLLTALTGCGHDVVVSIHIQPWAEAEAKRVTNDHYMDIADENTSYALNHSRPEKGYFVDETNMPRRMVAAEEGAKRTLDEVASDRQRMFTVTFAVSVFGRDEDELATACEDVESVFAAANMPGLESWQAMREQTYTTMLPLGVNLLPYGRSVLTDPLTALVPFNSAEYQDKGGSLLGVNAETNNLLLYSRTARSHTNALILGMSGGGKSVITKLQVLQTRLKEPEATQYLVDPEGENVLLTEAMGGQVIKISETSRYHINPLDISEHYASTDPDSMANPVPSKTSFVIGLVRRMVPDLTVEQENILDEACKVLYAPWLRSHDPEDIPTLGDLAEWLRDARDDRARAAHALATKLYRFTEGSFSYFNHRTDVDLASNLVDLSLVDMSDELRPYAMSVILDQIWVRVTANLTHGERTYLWVDEVQTLLDDPQAVKALDNFWSRGRKWDLYNTAITQSVARLLDVQETSYMLSNSPLVILTKQSGAYAQELVDLYHLSQEQEDLLQTLTPGEGLAVIDTQPVHYDFTLDPEVCPRIYELVTTKPDDLRAKRRDRAKRQEREETHTERQEDEMANKVPWAEPTDDALDEVSEAEDLYWGDDPTDEPTDPAEALAGNERPHTPTAPAPQSKAPDVYGGLEMLAQMVGKLARTLDANAAAEAKARDDLRRDIAEQQASQQAAIVEAIRGVAAGMAAPAPGASTETEPPAMEEAPQDIEPDAEAYEETMAREAHGEPTEGAETQQAQAPTADDVASSQPEERTQEEAPVEPVPVAGADAALDERHQVLSALDEAGTPQREALSQDLIATYMRAAFADLVRQSVAEAMGSQAGHGEAPRTAKEGPRPQGGAADDATTGRRDGAWYRKFMAAQNE